MASIEIGKLVEVLNRELGQPWFPKNFFSASVSEDGEAIQLSVGDRDVSIDTEGRVRGAGAPIQRAWIVREREKGE